MVTVVDLKKLVSEFFRPRTFIMVYTCNAVLTVAAKGKPWVWSREQIPGLASLLRGWARTGHFSGGFVRARARSSLLHTRIRMQARLLTIDTDFIAVLHCLWGKPELWEGLLEERKYHIEISDRLHGSREKKFQMHTKLIITRTKSCAPVSKLKRKIVGST